MIDKKDDPFIMADDLQRLEQIVNKRKLWKQFPSLYKECETEEEAFLKEMLGTLEFEVIDLWDPESETAKDDFRSVCNRIVDVIQILPVPTDDIQKTMHMLRLIIYGYLGDTWETIHRFLIENESKVKVDCEKGEWDARLLKTIYMSIFYLIRRHTWSDLEEAIKLVNKLRQDQKLYEREYLTKEKNFEIPKAFEIASLYHLAKNVELLGEFQLQGQPTEIVDRLDYHFDYAIKFAESGRIVELNLIARMLKPTFRKMVSNSVWAVASKVNSRVRKFVELLVKASPPIIEFMQPQRYSILEQGLLDPAHKAIVVNLPTSSGKTLIAEFSILQALNQFSIENGWVAYVVPTRALVNQIAVRLRNDLSKAPLSLKIEKMSGALEIDAYEYELITAKSDFNVLVTTPEKLSLLVRQKVEQNIARPLVLVVVDEAHNIESGERGVNLETLLSIIKKDCQFAHFLLMTPFIPNPDKLAKWLDPQNSKSISLDLHFWKPNDMVIGMFSGERTQSGITTYFTPLITSNKTMFIENKIMVKEDSSCELSKGYLTKKFLLTALLASQLGTKNDNTLVIARTKEDTYKIAEELCTTIAEKEPLPEKIELVKTFVSAELGAQFPLVRYLDKRIGIHHAGLPDDIRALMEQLMESRLLKYLVATTTIAQGINFDITKILMAAYSYPRTSEMPVREFWNLVGRAGRVYSGTPGIVGIATTGGADSLKLTEFVKQRTEDLVSALAKLINSAFATSKTLDLKMHYREPGWSMFLQYIAHMLMQAKNLDEFIAEIEMTLRRTYAYSQLTEENKRSLLESVKNYAVELNSNKGLAALSDSTGFSPETIQSITRDVWGTKLTAADWNANSMFSTNPDTLKKLVGIMLRTPEIGRHLKGIKIKGHGNPHDSLARLISDWVRGKDIPEISRTYFGSDNYKDMSTCVSAIYSQLTMSATWGLSAFQKLPSSGLDWNLNDKERKQLSNLPAMIYYGVDTDEAVLLRKASVPRTISKQLGKTLQSEFGDSVYNKTASEVSAWLNQLSDDKWQNAVPREKKIKGSDYKRVWQILSGYS